ncbi:NACHT, LRR and PYD domains-containing protein 14-like [Protopterus annectens]|uniref:NACHT, LRR and PYD domains-containing protein 14-like n=1 Tax=Protopterus annectens TaxID=7888 RepID=UPI001CFAD6D2|nr:NACHT, LRR and PYD domains-containing protein 14-like [Protopterus annectens]XP_043932657.1 NACHT, LRR and PYD domains-containing protein 14-like [Protopterus annectens]
MESQVEQQMESTVKVPEEFIPVPVPDSVMDYWKQHTAFLNETYRKISPAFGKKKGKQILLNDYAVQLIAGPAYQPQLQQHEILSGIGKYEEWQQQSCQNELQTVQYDHLFQIQSNEQDRPTTVLILGVAGIGKTTLVQKISHEWAQAQIYQEFHFMLPFNFNDLRNLENVSISDMILHSYPYLKDGLEIILQDPKRVLFIFDGLEESNGTDNYNHGVAEENSENVPHLSPEWKTSSANIINHLLRGELLQGCSVLFTITPTAFQALDLPFIKKHAEIMGFSEEQRRCYFLQFFEDPKISEEMYQCVKKHSMLYPLCYIPTYCWIICSIMEATLKTSKGHKSDPHLPITITQLYSSFIYNMLKCHSNSSKDFSAVLQQLGEMSYMGVCNNVTVFDESQLSKYNLQSSQALSGFLQDIFQTDPSCKKKLYTFLHLTVQEFIAALMKSVHTRSDDITSLLDEASQHSDGRGEMFLKFFIGLTSSNNLLQEFVGKKDEKITNNVLDWVKQKVEAQLDREFIDIDAFGYLYESQNTALTQTLMKKFSEIGLRHRKLSALECSVLHAMLQHCNVINNINFELCNIFPQSLRILTPVLHKSKHINLNKNYIGDLGMKWLSEALKSPHTQIQNLELEKNSIKSEGIKFISEALKSANCKLKNLKLGNEIPEWGHFPNTWKLQLADNELDELGMKYLSEALQNPHCKLQELWLHNIGIGEAHMKLLAVALKSPHCKIQELKLFHNNLGKDGAKLLSEALQSPHCHIRSLALGGNNIGAPGVQFLSEALKSPHSKIVKLGLSKNQVEDEGIKWLTEALMSHHCKIQSLGLHMNNVENSGAELLSKVLQSPHNDIQYLGLMFNGIGEAGMTHLLEALGSPHCKIQKLDLEHNSFHDVHESEVYKLVTEYMKTRPHAEIRLPTRGWFCGNAIMSMQQHLETF